MLSVKQYLVYIFEILGIPSNVLDVVSARGVGGSGQNEDSSGNFSDAVNALVQFRSKVRKAGIDGSKLLALYDNSYVDVSGVWCASSIRDNIWVSAESNGAILSLTGGTIFNGGATDGDCGGSECNGITVNGGTFSLVGVHIRNNRGRGIWIPNGNVKRYVISGCKIYSNGQGLNLQGESFVVSGNVISDNGERSNFGSSSAGSVVATNVCLDADAGAC